jgi:Zn-dependent peptidase ImmA (M78 family)
MTCFASRKDHPASLPVVVVNKRKSLERRRFTLAHELAHRVFNSDHFGCSRDEENAAQRFAGAFLMHADHLRREAGNKREKIGYQEIVFLKRIYRVSAAALAMRLEQIGIIAKATLSTIFQTIGRTWRTVEPVPLEEAGQEGSFERPKRFERLSLWALAEQFISPGKAMELLQISLEQLERAMAGPNACRS